LNSQHSCYEPLFTLKSIDEDLWIADGDNIRFYGVPFTTRMTIVRLDNGDLFVHSPIKLTQTLKSEITKLGHVRHLVSPNWIHYAFIAEWSASYENTIAWASPNVQQRSSKYGSDVHFDHNLGETAETDWANEIDQMIVRGSSIHTEVVFFHRSSKTLILTDLIINLEAEKIPKWIRPLAWIVGVLDPDGKMPLDMRMTFLKNRNLLRNAVERLISWEPEKIIISHGRWYETDGVEELQRAFRWILS